WIAGFAILTTLAVIGKGNLKTVGINVLLVYSTLFVISAIYSTFQGRAEGDQTAFTQADRAELMLKINSGLLAVERHFPASDSTMKTVKEQKDQFYTEAQKAIDKALDIAPKAVTLRMKKAILLAEIQPSRTNVIKQLDVLKAMKEEKPQQLYDLLNHVYITRKIPKEEGAKYEKIAEKQIPPGWYREVVTVQIMRAADNKKEFNKRVDDFQTHYQWYVVKLFLFIVAALVSALIGIIVIFVQLFFLKRAPSDEERRLIAAPEGWSWKAVYGVFLGWLTLEFIIGPILHSMTDSFSKIATDYNSITVALVTAGVYLIQTVPALFFIWLFAFRPAKIGYFEGIKLKMKSGKLGPFRLVLAGVLTWFAAVPVIMVSTVIATKLGSQGSTNPIVPIVLAAAKDGNPLGSVLFFIALGVLPALCEETLFRGFLYTTLRRTRGAFTSIVISAALFSLVHMDLGGAIQLFALGFLFAFVFERTKSLIPSMVAHCMWNSVTFGMALTAFG
ncbi:MAG: CPBP family intramembrane metalloprotease, partial [Cyanobacteria bacterium]|nr:CPBP family intramembrane metalloprotease [Cyanobacteriota bacterium]